MKQAPEKSRKIYVDTNVWIGFLTENDRFAIDFFSLAAECHFTIIASDIVIKELIDNDAFDEYAFNELERREKVLIRPVTATSIAQARSLPSHWPDSLHAAIALREGVPLLTWNTKDFIIPGLIVLKPNEIKNKHI